MKVMIDTGHKNMVKLALCGPGIFVEHNFRAHMDLAERLLPEIMALLKKNSKNLVDISRINVNDQGDSFTSLRIGIVTANSLAFALGIPVSSSRQSKDGEFVAPKYDREPSITDYGSYRCTDEEKFQ